MLDPDPPSLKEATMRQLILALTAFSLTAGPAAFAQTPAPQTSGQPATAMPAPTPVTVNPIPTAPTTAAAPRTEKVCKMEPIANSRLRKRKICVDVTTAQRSQQDQKENVRRAMRDYGASTQRGN
jgi:hypothetical protein